MSYNLKDLICRGNITLEIVDDSALYKAELMSSIGNIFRNNDTETEITLSVFKGINDITHKFTDIEWKRFTFNSNGEDDKSWGDKHKGKRAITVTKEEIEGKAVIQCAVYQIIEGERELVAAQSITFIDIKDMVPSAKPPLNPMDGEIWIDNSVDPPVIKVWYEEKGQWITITVAGASTKNLINNSNFWKAYDFTDFKLIGNLQDYRIAPYQGKRYAQLRADFYDDEIRGFYQDISKSYYPEETYLMQAKAYILDETGMYDGGLSFRIVDVTTKQGPNLEEIEVETEIISKTFKLRNDKVSTIHTTFTMPTKINKLRVYVYGERETAFHIAVTELSLSHNAQLHDWEMSDDDLQWKIDNKVNNDPKEVFEALTDGGKMQGIYTAINPDTGNDDYYINANYIKSGQVEADYINAKGLTVSRDINNEDGTTETINTLEITKDGEVHIIADKFSLRPYAETNVPTKSEVETELNTKVDADKESIVNAINDTGMFLENGKLTLNADNVSTGVLKSKNNVSVFNLNAGTFRLGNSDDYFKLKFDGENLLFGQGAIKWENLDNSVVEELTPYDAYLEKTSVIVTDDINQTSVTYSETNIVIPDNKPTNRVLATKGNNKLIAVDTTPKQGEFSFRILEQNGCTAIKHSPSEFYVDKVTQENAYVRVSISCEDKQILTRTMTITMSNVQGSAGPPGNPGPAGDMAAFIYCKSKERPAKPTGNNPEGWYERIEEIIEQGDLWCSQGIKAADTGELKGEWQMPYKLEEMNNNLLSNYPWTPGVGECGIYLPLGGSTENIRTYDKDPKGNQSIVWTAISQDANGVMEFIDGGFTASVKIDHTKTYRFSVWAKASDKNCYINMSADITNTADKDGTSNPNPVFFNSTLPEVDKWYLIVGYVLGSGIPHNPTNSGVYDSENGDRIMINGKEQSLPIFKNKDGAEKQSIRVFMSGGETIGVNAKFFDPRIEIIDGEEQSIDSILGKMSNMKWIYEWNGTKTEINGSSVLTPKLFTGTIDEITGKHTGVAMGMDVLGDGQNGIVGYSKGLKTFHIKTDGSAIFGDESKDHIEISNNGIATIPVVKGDNIQANKLVVYYTDSNGEQILDENKKPIKTLEVTDRGEVILHPSKFEMLSGIIGGGGSGEDSESNALVPQLQELGMIFDMNANPPQFTINATQIKTGQLTADRLDLYGLTIYKQGTSIPTFKVDYDGSITIRTDSFKLDTGTQDSSFDAALNSMVSSIIVDPTTIRAIAEKVEIISDFVTFSDLSGSRTTTINGDNITTGTIRCDRIGTANKYDDAIIKLFHHNNGDCAIDATANMNSGQGTAIRLKWDNNNYYLVESGDAKIFLNGDSKYTFGSGTFTVNSDKVTMKATSDGHYFIYWTSGGGGIKLMNNWETGVQIRGSNDKNYVQIVSSKFTVGLNKQSTYSSSIQYKNTKDVKNYLSDIEKLNIEETIEYNNQSLYKTNDRMIEETVGLSINAYDATTPDIIKTIIDKSAEDKETGLDLLSVACLGLKGVQELIVKIKLLENKITELETKLNGGEITNG